MSLRGNKLVNNNLVPFVWANGSGSQLTPFASYSDPYMDTTASPVPIPTLDQTNSIYPRLKGTFPAGKAPYTNVIIDVYQLDPEGWTNGQAIAGAQSWYLENFTDSFTFTNGFPQGMKYLGSRTVPNTGTFDIDISGLQVGSGSLTVTANYSADPAGTRHGRSHTGNFANPFELPAQVSIRPSGNALVLSWPVSKGIYKIQSTPALATGWTDLSPQPPVAQVGSSYEATIQISGPRAFYRLAR